MNQITKKLLLSVLTVVLTVIALGTTTFAWFTLTDTATVQPFEVDIVADVGMEISLDEVTWVTTLTTSMVEARITELYGQLRLDNVYSPNGYQFETLVGGLAPTSGYLRLPVYFRSNNVEVVAWTGVTLQSQTVNWLADVSYTDTASLGAVLAGDTVRMAASHGARVSVRSQVGTSYTVVYELPDGAEGHFGVTAPDKTNTRLSGTVAALAWDQNTPGGINYYFVKTTEAPVGTADEHILPNTVSTINQTAGNYYPVLDLILGYEGGTPSAYAAYERGGLLYIYVYIEGWDPDTFNAILSDMLRVSLEFKDQAQLV